MAGEGCWVGFGGSRVGLRVVKVSRTGPWLVRSRFGHCCRTRLLSFSPQARTRKRSGLEQCCSRVLQRSFKKHTLAAASNTGAGMAARRLRRECAPLASDMAWERQKRRGRMRNYPDRPAARASRRKSARRFDILACGGAGVQVSVWISSGGRPWVGLTPLVSSGLRC